MTLVTSVSGWIYPGSTLIGGISHVPVEYSDGRQLTILKPQYFTCDGSGHLTLDCSDGTTYAGYTCTNAGVDGYSPANAAAVKRYSVQQFITVAGAAGDITALAGSSGLRTTFNTTLTNLLGTTGFTGIEFDLEASWAGTTGTTNFNNLKTVISSTVAALHTAGYQLMVSGPGIGVALESAYKFSYAALEALTTPPDYYSPQVYDHFYDTSGVGDPGAPLSWITDVCNMFIAQVSNKDKVVMGIGNHGWHGTTGGFAATYEDYVQSQAETGFNTATRESTSDEMTWTNAGTFYDYTDSTTLNDKLATILASGFTHIGVWHLGGNGQWFTSQYNPPISSPALNGTVVKQDTFAGRTVSPALTLGTASSGATWNTIASGGSTATTLAVRQGQGIAYYDNSGAGNGYAEVALNGSVSADTEVLCRFCPLSSGFGQFGIFTRYSSGVQFYRCSINPGASHVSIDKMSGGTYTAGTTFYSVTMNTNTYYWVRFRTVGSTQQVRIWADGTTEPGTWAGTQTDTSVAAGGQIGMMLVPISTAPGGAISFDSLTAVAIVTPPTFTGVQIAIGGTAVHVLEGSFEIDDQINAASTCMFTVRDDTGLAMYVKGQPVSVTDPAKGTVFTGYISSVDRQNKRPSTVTFSKIACVDQHLLAMNRTYSGPEYVNEYAGVIAADLLNTLAPEGITAQYASRREVTQTQLAAGTLTNTTATNNVGTGDLELGLAGTTFTKTEITAGDFNAGTLTNVTGTASGLVLSSSSVLKYTGAASPNLGGNLYAYTEFYSSNTSIGSNYTFSYDIFISSTSPAISGGVDFVCTDGTTFRDSGFRDVLGFGAHPSTVLAGYANDQWYHRDFLLTTANTDFNGKTIDYAEIGFEGEAAGTYTCYVDNVVLKNGSNSVVATFYSGGAPAVNKRLGMQGYSGVKLSNVTAYQNTGQRISPSYTITSAGIVRDSLLSWIMPTYVQPLASNANNYPSPVVVESSIDGGATWQACTNNAPLPNLPAGISASGMGILLRETLNLAGPDPTIAPVLTEVVLTVDPSYFCSKSDIHDIDTSSSDFAGGSLTNVQYVSAAGGEQITGSYRSWDDGSLANQTTYGVGGGNPIVSISSGQLSLRTNSGPFEMRSRFDFAGQWQNFVMECDIAHFSDITSNINNGIVYRCTGWQNNNDTYAYSLQIESGSIALTRGTNSSSGSGASTLIQRTTVAFEASKFYHIKLVVNGSSHQAYVNDIQYINATDGTFSGAGYLGARLYNNSSARNSAFFDNFGIMSSAFTGNRVHSSLSLNALGSVYGSIIQWNADVPGNTTLLIESSINGGSTWATCTSGATIPQLTNGVSVSGVSLLIRETLTTQNANATPTLDGISVYVMGVYSASGTRVSPSLSLANVGRMGSSIVAWNSVLPTNTTLGVDVAIDGGSWTDVSGSNGGTLPGLTGQPAATDDSFTNNTSANYTSTNRTGGSTATWTYDTTNSRITASGGSSALYVWNSVTGVGDVSLFIDMDESDTGGVLWRYTDINNHYELVIQDGSSTGTHNIAALFKVVAGTRTQIGSNVAISFVRGTYHRFWITMQGTAIVVQMDGVQIISTTDASLASGKTGLRTSGTVARFYQIYVQPLGQNVSTHSVQTRLRLASTSPTATPQVTNVTLAAFGNTIQAGALIPQTAYNNDYISNAFDDLMKQSSASGTQWWWLIDKNKTFSFLPNNGVPAPWIASDNPGDFLNAGLTVSDLSDLYRNRQKIKNVMQTATINESRQGDGVTRSWAFGYQWASAPTVLINGVAASVGVKGVDTGKTFYYAVGDNTITIDALVTTFTSAFTLAFSGTGQYLTTAQYDNATEQNALSLLGMGSGIVENVEDGTGLTYAAGLALAQARVKQYGVRGQTIVAGTIHSGLAVGQLLNIFLPPHNINDGLFLLRQMKTTLTIDPNNPGMHMFWYDLTLINGADIGSWEKLYLRQ